MNTPQALEMLLASGEQDKRYRFHRMVLCCNIPAYRHYMQRKAFAEFQQLYQQGQAELLSASDSRRRRLLKRMKEA